MSTAEETLSVKAQVSEEEWEIRVNLAACYRLIAMHGWDDLIFTHISARVPGPDEHFLINAYGLLFEEMTASSLVKVNLDGGIVLDTRYFVNPAGFTIHSAVHAAREDAGCVLHTHTKAGVAVSAQTEGLLPISQISLFPFSSLSYHDYEGIALNEEEKPRLVADLGSNNFLILRNHGPAICRCRACAGLLSARRARSRLRPGRCRPAWPGGFAGLLRRQECCSFDQESGIRVRRRT